MSKKFQCRVCGKIIIGSNGLLDHCKSHHPAVSGAKLDIFLKTEFKAIDNQSMVLPDSAPAAVKRLDSNGRIIKSASGARKQKPGPKYVLPPEEYIPLKRSNFISGTNVKSLFDSAVTKVAEILQRDSEILEPRTHKQWMNICFGQEREAYIREEYMSKIKSEYASYFLKSSFGKYAFDLKKIKRDFPYLFKGESISKAKGIDLMIEVIQKEMRLLKDHENREKFKVNGIECVNRDQRLYKLRLDLSDSNIPNFNEGFPVDLLVNNIFFNCTCLEYDESESTLFVISNRLILRGNKGMIYVDLSFILESILQRLLLIREQGFSLGQPGVKFLNESPYPLSFYSRYEDLTGDFENVLCRMDESQSHAIQEILSHDISFVWGPPGTGKSYTMAGLINIFYRRNETTIICCISNVAVDQLLQKVIAWNSECGCYPQNCEMIRTGHTTDNQILSTDYLFPKDSECTYIRKKIKRLNDKIKIVREKQKYQHVDISELELVQERIKLRESLKERTENLVNGSRIVFSTMAYYALSSIFRDKPFDNLIVDEASMLSMPYLMALCPKIFKRLILVGDPNQLGPISVFPDSMLSDSVFDQRKVLDIPNFPGLYRLKIQRRSHKSIVGLTNKIFYDNVLECANEHCPDWIYHDPFPGKIVKIVNEDIENDEMSLIGSSRNNHGTCEKTLEILYDIYYNENIDYTIGIITPFRAQVKLYRSKIRKLYDSTNFWQNIKVGTVHTFQGSECDLIFFDLVESSRSTRNSHKVSKLFHGREGERLINVALSRARHKLIVVGDTLRFRNGNGLANVSDKVIHAITNLTDISAPPLPPVPKKEKIKKRKRHRGKTMV